MQSAKAVLSGLLSCQLTTGTVTEELRLAQQSFLLDDLLLLPYAVKSCPAHCMSPYLQTEPRLVCMLIQPKHPSGRLLVQSELCNFITINIMRIETSLVAKHDETPRYSKTPVARCHHAGEQSVGRRSS